MAKHKKIIKRYKPLPLHTWEAHPKASAGGISKPFVIAIITIFALVLLSLFLFFQDQLVGKAFQTGTASIGLSGTDQERTFAAGQSVSVPIRANLGTRQTVALGFSIALPSGVTCSQLANPPFENLLGWNDQNGLVISVNECRNNVATFRMATLNADQAKTGSDLSIANLRFNNLPVGRYPIQLSNIEIIDFRTHQDMGIRDATGREIIVNQPVPECADGQRNGLETDVDCGGTGNCPRCAGGQVCMAGSDCLTAVCTAAGRCAATICSPQSRQTCGPDDCVSVGQGVWNTAAGTCDVALIDACQTNTDCTTVGLRACNTAVTPNVCVQCLSNTDCSAPTPRCNLQTNTCGATDTCGNNIVDAGEQCDDGNVVNADGCSATCLRECSSTNLAACTTQVDCEAQQGIYDTTGTTAVCRAATCSDRVTLCRTEATCRAAQGIWSDRCRAAGACSATNLIGCNTVVTCAEQNGMWDITGANAECRAPRCTGVIPNSQLCSSDDQGLTVDTPRAIVQSCTTPVKCEHTCATGSLLQNTPCVPESTATLFRTRITVGDGFPTGTFPTATVYTYLKDNNNKILVFKKEEMTGVGVYEAIVHYAFPDRISTKEVVVEDYPPRDSRRTFYGKLEVDVVTNELKRPVIEPETNGRKRLIFGATVQN